MKVLFVEDDAETSAYVVHGLDEHGYVIDHSTDGLEGYFLASTVNYDVAIIDRMLPGLDGLSIVRQLRSNGIKTPVLFLTSVGGIDDRVEGLEAGADDYLVKPFAFSELLARVNALGRRPAMAAPAEAILRCADLELDLLTYRAYRGGREISLQPREFKLLEFLMRNAGRVVTRSMLLEMVWDFHFEANTNIVETHLSRLRSKVDRGFARELIRTVRGVGYSLSAQN